MNSRFKTAGALFASLAMLGASALSLVAAPASAATGCETSCQFGFTEPAGVSGTAFELGLQFQSDIPAYLEQICFYAATGETGGHTVTLWDNTGTKLTTASVGDVGTGRICVALADGWEIPANTTFTASYASNTAFDFGAGGFASQADNGHLHAPANAGVFSTPGSFPTSVFSSSNYGVDVMLSTPVPPTPVITSVAGFSTTAAAVAFDHENNSNGVYTVTCQSLFGGAVTATGTSSPIIVNGLGNKETNDRTISDAITCTVVETDVFVNETSAVSAPSPVALLGVAQPGCTSPALTPPVKPSSAPGNASATVSWAPTQYAPPHGCVAGYVVTPTVGGVAQPPIVLTGSGTTTVIKGLTNGQTYTFTIAAENGSFVGPESVPTAPIVVGSPTAAAAVKVARIGTGAVKVAFKPAKGNGAPVTRYTASCHSFVGEAKTKVGKASPLTVTGLLAGRLYVCTVSASNSRGAGPSVQSAGFRA